MNDHTPPSERLSFNDKHLGLLKEAFRQVISVGTVTIQEVQPIIARFQSGGWDAITDDEARLLSHCPEALQQLSKQTFAQVDISGAAANTEQWFDDISLTKLAAASRSDEPYLVYQGRNFKIWCYPSEDAHTRQLVTLETNDPDARKNDVYICVFDSNNQLLMEGELVDGELTVETETITNFLGPFLVKYRFLS